MLHYFRGGNKPAHRRGPVPMTGLLPTRNTLPHTHAQQQHRHRTPFRDIRHVLTTAKFTWHWSVWSDPRKATETHKRAGAFVFVECHTSSRGKPVTGPWRPLKLRGRGVWESPLWLPLMSTPILGLWAISWIRIVFVRWEENHPRIVYQSTDELITASL